jgi:hypothetical protein
MNGPEQVPDNSEHSAGDFQDWKGFTRPGEESHFKYNPAASDITPASGDFPLPDGPDAPEKE